MININVVRAAQKTGVKVMLSALSTCIYPDKYKGENKLEDYAMVEDDI
jgi:hypothetical protein